MDKVINNDMSEYWNGAGADNWIAQHKKADHFLLPLGQKAMEVAGIEDNELVLDIGCGCGETSFDIASLVGPSGHVNGLDISRPIITEARVNKKQLGVKNVTFQCGDAQNFELKKGVYDLIYSRFGVTFFDDPVAAFSNIRSALDKNGRLTFVCWQPAMENQWISQILKIISKYVELPEPVDIEAPGPFSFSSPDRVQGILSDAGYANIDISAYHCSVSFGDNATEAADFLTKMGPAGSAISKAQPSLEVLVNIKKDIKKAIMPSGTSNEVELGAATWIVTAQNSPV